LDSIPRREDVQIIVVDDNSDNNIVDFEIFPGLNDPFVEIIFGKNENGRKGAGYARNLGLERAKGKWLIFADADDFFMPCFNEVLDKYVDDENDIIYFKLTSVYSDTMLPANKHKFSMSILERAQISKQYDVLFEFAPPWGKFIKRCLVEKYEIQFREYFWSNDVLFSVKCGINATTNFIANEIIYCQTIREGSLMYSHNLESLKIRFHSNYESVLFLKKHNKKGRRSMILLAWWNRIYFTNKKVAFFLLPNIIYSCGLNFVLKKIVFEKLKYQKNKFKFF